MQAVKARIEAAARAAARSPEEVCLVAVSKTFPLSALAEAYAAGQRAFGESYVQEGVNKIRAHSGTRSDVPGVASPEGPLLRPLERHVASPHGENSGTRSDVRPSTGVASPEGPLLRPLEWHFIGPIQSNKTRQIAEYFHWVHGLDRAKIAERLSETRSEIQPPLQVCIQVNVSGENSKSGVAPEEVLALAQLAVRLPRLRLRGLMTIPEPTPDVQLQRSRFRMLRELRDEVRRRGIELDTLSMGMSDDLEAAIAEGATIVRVGRAIFGERP